MAKTKRKRKKRHDSLVLQLMILVAVVLVVFEGRLVVTMITHRSSMKSTTVTDSTAAAAVQDGTLQTQASAAAAAQNGDTVLAGLPTVKASSAAAAATPETQAETHATTSDPSEAPPLFQRQRLPSMTLTSRMPPLSVIPGCRAFRMLPASHRGRSSQASACRFPRCKVKP